MKKSIAAIAIIGMALYSAPSAMAHAQLSSSFPRAGSVVRVWPTKMWVEFDGNLIQLNGKSVNQLVVKDSLGKEIDSKDSNTAGARLTVSTKKIPALGRITVSWRVVSEDGHPVSNSFSFTFIPQKK